MALPRLTNQANDDKPGAYLFGDQITQETMPQRLSFNLKLLIFFSLKKKILCIPISLGIGMVME